MLDLAKMLVSFTGVDDKTDLKELSRLYWYAAELGIATEYGVLVFPEKEGTGRNPSFRVQQEIVARLPAAAHLCGVQVFHELLNPITRRTRLKQLKGYERVQVNINARGRVFNTKDVHSVYAVLLDADHTVILQHHADAASDIEWWLEKQQHLHNSKIHILNDASRGTGVVPEVWTTPRPGMISGYAGGLSPENIRDELPKIQEAALKASKTRDYWIDMESGVRRNNVFDTTAVLMIIEYINRMSVKD